MKKILLLSSVLAFFFIGCQDDGNGPDPGMIWDFTNYSVCFSVTDNQGNNLLEYNTEGNILENDIKVTYRDKQYKIEIDEGPEPQDAEPKVRYNMPRELGLRVEKTFQEVALLHFGEFSPQSDYHNEEFTIDWGDGKKDKVSFNLYITWKKHNPTVHHEIYLNSKLYSNKSFLIEIKK